MAGESRVIRYRPEIAVDLKQLGRGQQRRLLQAIEERLTLNPDSYGKPLKGVLRNLRRIRVGDFRIAYQVCEHEVVIWAIKHRKEIYSELERRFGRRILDTGE